MVGSTVWLSWSYDDTKSICVLEGVAEVRDLVNGALEDETMITLHRVSDGAMVAIDPVSVRLVEPAMFSELFNPLADDQPISDEVPR